MNRLYRIAALGAALALASTVLVGCRNEKDISEKLSIISESCEKTVTQESGEILIYKTLKVDTDIEGVAENSSEETYIKYANNTGDPDFTINRTSTVNASEQSSSYEFVKEGDILIELYDGVGNFAQTAPDIFEGIRLDFDVSDIESIEVTSLSKGVKEYNILMTDEYADTFDSESDGTVIDCTKVVYCYYIDSMLELSNILRETTSTLTHNGESQTMVEFIDAKID